MPRLTNYAKVREALRSMGTSVIEDTSAAGTVDLDKTIEDAESFVIDTLPEKYRRLAMGFVEGEIVVFQALSTTTSFITKFFPVNDDGTFFLLKNISPEGVDLRHIHTENNANLLIEDTDYSFNKTTGAVTNLELLQNDRLVMTYTYSLTDESLYDPASPGTQYNIPRELTRIATDAGAFFTLRHLYNTGRADFLLNTDILSDLMDGVNGALQEVRDGKRSFHEYDDIDFYEDWDSGDPDKGRRPYSIPVRRG